MRTGGEELSPHRTVDYGGGGSGTAWRKRIHGRCGESGCLVSCLSAIEVLPSGKVLWDKGYRARSNCNGVFFLFEFSNLLEHFVTP